MIYFISMKSLILLLFSAILSISSYELAAQTKAVTEKGDTIFVYDNGTWSYELEEIDDSFNDLDFLKLPLSIDTLTEGKKYPSSAKSEVRSKENGFVVRYDDKKWKRVPPGNLNAEADFAFENKFVEIWCVVIAEESSFSPDNLFRIAKMTMEKNLDARTQILKTELVTVNGNKVLRGVVKADVSGISFVFDSYYYSNELGSVQFTTWTSENLWKKYESEIAELLNGFVAEQ